MHGRAVPYGPVQPAVLGEVAAGHGGAANLDRPDVARRVWSRSVVDDADLDAGYRDADRYDAAGVGPGVGGGDGAFVQIVAADHVHADRAAGEVSKEMARVVSAMP